MKKTIGLIFGTRPEIIKLSPIIRLLAQQKKPHFLLHTGQHYSYEMDRLFFKELGLPEPRFQLSVGSGRAVGHGEQTGRMMAAIEKIIEKEKPGVVLVQGDTNSVLAGSLVTAKIPGVRLGHVEAGLRSGDRSMPEEINRVISDHVSDILFAPTAGAKKILLKEGVLSKKIFVTGNTIVDAVKQNLSLAQKKVNFSAPLFGLTKRPFFLLTLHRQENVDNPHRLTSILKGLERASHFFKCPILFPMHPRTLKRLEEFGLSLPRGVEAFRPVGFLEFLSLEAKAALLLTDSGGVQEESCILNVPCVTLRTSTERPETVTVGANVIAGVESDNILRCAKEMIQKKRIWPNPFGDGQSAQRILEILNAS